MTFEYQSKIYLGEVAIYVADLAGRTGGFGQGRTSSGETFSDQ